MGERKNFDDWITALREEVIEGEYGYEPGEFAVYPDAWRHMWQEGLTPAEAFKRALDAHAEARRQEEEARKANWARIQAEGSHRRQALPAHGRDIRAPSQVDAGIPAGRGSTGADGGGVDGDLRRDGRMTDKPQRRVVCAAIRFDGAWVACAPRHSDATMHATVAAAGRQGLHGGEQGFVDQWGAFMDRAEAWTVASSAGQILHMLPGREGRLYSENLY